MNKYRYIIICDECSSDELDYDLEKGEFFCTNCENTVSGKRFVAEPK